ncbi:hypothetical protein QWY84_11160 [Aquisalimonas lutea]|uniref:hypothetical protein n=1 Tax=Aquisalimonas lutea TaxID=1327750 RepID=UPI0025B30C87|nr:hypothetical protein [Aquisalimonas lutea]MDN3518170.1 hypothetical protein [Aquisalimonas lutea]
MVTGNADGAGARSDGRQYTAVLDLRVHDRLERLPLLELTLSSLTVGEDLLLMTAAAPERLQAHVARHYGERVQWQPLQCGPPLWRARLVRVASGDEAEQ